MSQRSLGLPRSAKARRRASRPDLERMEDRFLLSGTYIVTSNGDSGATGQLRDAINQVNAGNVTTVIFKMPGNTITLGSSPLPPINPPAGSNVLIDATTQTGFSGQPIVALIGTGAGNGANGLTLAGNNITVKGFQISGFQGNGIVIQGNNDWVYENDIGVVAVSSTATANSGDGILVSNVTGTTIGSPVAGQGNVISGNKSNGIEVTGSTVTGTVIEGNTIGLDTLGTSGIGNVGEGILLNVPNATVSGNVISANTLNGIHLQGGASGALIQGNTIGTNSSGSSLFSGGRGSLTLLGNGQAGIFVDKVPGTTIAGGANTQVISGNGTILSSAGGGGGVGGGFGYFGTSPGILISGSAASGTLVQGNNIGTSRFGNTALPNGTDGIQILGSSSNTIGTGNVISGNLGDGINIAGSVAGATTVTPSGNLIIGNKIGTDSSGSFAVANGFNGNGVGGNGITLDNVTATTIGGTAAGQGNVISGNGSTNQYGIELDSGASATLIQGNKIGTNSAGTQAVGNAGAGILVNGAKATTIGGTTASAGNVIGGNNAVNGPNSTNPTAGGILIQNGSPGTQVEGNAIGTDRTGSVNLGNVGFGIGINGTSNVSIGGTVAGGANTIAFNKYAGVSLSGFGSNQNPILENAIYSNGGLGIDLGPSGNNRQGVPSLSSAVTPSTGNTVVELSLPSSPANTSYRLEFYSNPAGTSGTAQGQTFLGSQVVTTNATGNAAYQLVTLPTALPAGTLVTATITDLNGNTSGFSQSVAVQSGTATADLSVSLTAPPQAAVIGEGFSPTMTVTNNGPLTALGVTLVETLPAGVTYNSTLTTPAGNTPTVGTNASGETTLTYNVGTLASGGTFKAQVNTTLPSTGGNITFQANATESASRSQSSNAVDTATLPINVAAQSKSDLAVAVSGPAGTVGAGSTLTYTVTVTNHGPTDNTGVILTDTLPAGSTLVSVSPSTNVSGNGNTVTAALPTLTNGSSVSYKITVTAPSPSQQEQVTNTATVSGNGTDPVPSNNSQSLTTTIGLPGSFQFGNSSFKANESSGSATVTINRTNGSFGPATVQLSVTGGTAKAGTDFTTPPTTVNFGDGQTSATVTISLVADQTTRGNKTLNLTLSNPSTGAGLASQTTAVVNIVDDLPTNSGGGGGGGGGSSGSSGGSSVGPAPASASLPVLPPVFGLGRPFPIPNRFFLAGFGQQFNALALRQQALASRAGLGLGARAGLGLGAFGFNPAVSRFRFGGVNPSLLTARNARALLSARRFG